jgi:dolichol-phosphate mannosyltransferase
VIDDNSPDGTGQLADRLASEDPRIRVLHRPGKLGLGTATLAAMRFAMTNNYETMINMDADFSHHPRYLPELVDGMKDHDLMIGSRYVKGGGCENWPFQRLVISQSVNLLVRFLMGIPAKDCSGAFRCYRVSMLRKVDWSKVISRGYSFQQEVLYRCFMTGCRIGEIPIIFENRRAGVTKVNLAEMTRSFSLVVYLGMRAFAGMDRGTRVLPPVPAPASAATEVAAAPKKAA